MLVIGFEASDAHDLRFQLFAPDGLAIAHRVHPAPGSAHFPSTRFGPSGHGHVGFHGAHQEVRGPEIESFPGVGISGTWAWS